MANRRTEMRNIKEMLRLSEAGVNQSQIAVITKTNRETVRGYLVKLQAAGIVYLDCKELSDKELYGFLFSNKNQPISKKLMPDFKEVYQELKVHKYVTLQLLWEEYMQKISVLS